MKLYEYIIRRLLLAVLVLLAVSVLVFYLARGPLPPAALIVAYTRPGTSEIGRLSIAKGLGIAAPGCQSWTDFITYRNGCVVPLWNQYFNWLSNVVLKGNWGFTLLPDIAFSETTLQVFTSDFPYTVQLAVLGGALTIVLGIVIGVISATHANSAPDHVSRVGSVLGYSIPVFWFGFLLELLFVLYLNVNGLPILPTSGAIGDRCAVCFSNPGRITSYTGLPLLDAILSRNFAYAWDLLIALVLPVVTLTITSVAALSRILRSSLVEALRQDYVLMARSKGLKERVVVYRHALRNALLPAITVSGLIVAGLFGGVVIVETIFAYPGIGRDALAASFALDTNFLELFTLTLAAILVITNLIVDILYATLDPRIRY